jgi:hypothetical protein
MTPAVAKMTGRFVFQQLAGVRPLPPGWPFPVVSVVISHPLILFRPSLKTAASSTGCALLIFDAELLASKPAKVHFTTVTVAKR